jgi:hypothetical protein
MTKKFVRTMSDTVNDIRRDMNTAYDIKRDEIEDKNIPKWAKDALTPDEIRRSQRIGLAFGVGVIVLVLVAFCFWLLTNGVSVIR